MDKNSCGSYEVDCSCPNSAKVFRSRMSYLLGSLSLTELLLRAVLISKLWCCLSSDYRAASGDFSISMFDPWFLTFMMSTISIEAVSGKLPADYFSMAGGLPIENSLDAC